MLIRTIRGSAPVSCVHILTQNEKQFFHKFNKVGLNILHVKKWSILEFYLGKLSHQSVLRVSQGKGKGSNGGEYRDIDGQLWPCGEDPVFPAIVCI